MLAVGGEYLKIVAWNFVPSGIVFVSSSMFQAMGNTIPSLVSSFLRTSLLVIPALADVARGRLRAALDLVPVGRGASRSTRC